jgi:carbonic anhydrase
MDHLPELFEHNRRWAAAKLKKDPDFFERLCGIQTPDHLWIGCADSRVPANQIVGLKPGELFVHRNVANVVPPGDVNCVSVIQYAVDVLKIKHIIVTGHYACGGIQAALNTAKLPQPLDTWIDHVRAVRDAHRAELDALTHERDKWYRLCELNVQAQVRHVAELPMVKDAWARGQPLDVHGWIYDLHDGLLKDLGVTVGNT